VSSSSKTNKRINQ